MKRIKTLLTSALALGLAAGGALAQTADGIAASRISEDIRVLSQDSFGGRYPGTEGERLTLEHLQAQYEAMGLQPGGPDGQWLQRVELLRFTPARPATASWSAGGEQRPLTVGRDIVLRADSGDGLASIADAPLVFAGYGIHAPERGWDDYGDLDVRGAVVVVVSGEPDGELFNGAFPTLYSNGSYKNAEAFERGAVGVITLAMVGPENAGWQGLAARAGQTNTTVAGLDPAEFNGWVNIQTATAWAEAAGMDLRTLPQRMESGDFRAFRMGDLTLSVDIAETREILVTHNLLARIPGTERPEETIVYSAHWDHVGSRDTPDENGDTIYNGAWDNASGTAGVLEIARQFAEGPAPERSIVFAHMAAEEMGLLGAFYYAFNPVYPLETTVADLNIDMLPLSAPTRDIPVFGFGQNTLEDDLQTLADAEGRVVTDDGQPAQGFYYRSDHFPFAVMGVPALMPWHGVDLDEGGEAVGGPAYMAYFRSHYHRRNDEWQADWDLSSAVENLELLRRLGSDLANSERWPDWKPGSEFGATRAESAAARQ